MTIFNDFPHFLIQSDDAPFADDTLIYVLASEKLLNNDLDSVSSYFRENELVINLKVGKTECMMFGAAERLSKTTSKL